MLYQCRRYAKAVNRMDYRLLMDTSILAGEIIMENGGEAYRAEETVNRMLNTSNAKHVEVVVMGTSMVATVSNPYRDAITATRRIRRRGTNLQRIAEVNVVSREMCEGRLSLEEAFHQLEELREKKQYPEWGISCLPCCAEWRSMPFSISTAIPVYPGSSMLHCLPLRFLWWRYCCITCFQIR